MRLSLLGTCWLSLVCVGLVFAACGSDDAKKRVRAQYGGEGGGAAESGISGSPVAVTAGAPAGEIGGAPIELAGGAGAGGEGNGPVFHGLYVAPTGDDGALGTELAPFKTLEHAVMLAQSGDTIVFLDGSFVMANAPVTIPAGVELKAQNAGKATLTGGGTPTLFNLSGDTHISGLNFSGQQTVAQFAAAGNATGTLTIDDSSFSSCITTCLNLEGGGKAVVKDGSGAVLGNGGGAFATLSGTSSLVLSGGVLQNYGAGGIIRATDDTKLDLSGFEVQGGTGLVLSLDKQAVATVDGATIATLSQSLFKQTGTSELTVKNSDLSIKPQATGILCFDIEQNGVGKLTIDTSKLHDCGTGLKGSPPAELHLIGSEFYNLSFGGADLDNGSSEVGGLVEVEGCKFHDVGYTGMRIGTGNAQLNVTMHNTSFNVAGMVGWDALILNGASSSTIDLGTLAKPGGNTFVQKTAGSSAVRLQMQAVTVQAVGNTWTPSLEGADAQGHYSVVSGKTLDITAAVNTGINYVKPYATTTLRLAQIP